MHSVMDRKAFFAAVRGSLFSSLSTSQVSGTEALLDAFEAARWPLTHAAYGLATAYHETDRTMQPIREKGSDAYLDKYDTGKLAKALGNTPEDDDDGILYCGRGYVQLTGTANYRKAEKALRQPLLSNPDLAMRPDIAAMVMVRGMTEGWFTGKANRHYLDKQPPDYFSARRIINGIDKAATIAAQAKAFEKALVAGGWGTQKAVEAPPVTPKLPEPPKVPVAPQAPSEPQETPPGFWSRFWASLVSRISPR